MKKRILGILLTLCMLFCLVPVTASAMVIFIDLKIVGQASFSLEVEATDSIDDVKEKFGIKRAFLPMRKDCFWTKKSLRTGAR